MLIFILVLLSASATQVRWAHQPDAAVKAQIETLRECGVEGRPLVWRQGSAWMPHLLVSDLPARVNPACRAPWVFLHDQDMLALLRQFMVTHEGLLLNLRGVGAPSLVRRAGQKGFADLRELDAAVDEAALEIQDDTDLYRLTGALTRLEDAIQEIRRPTTERFALEQIPQVVLEPTLKFVREARVSAATAHALTRSRREAEFQLMNVGEIMHLNNVVVSQQYRVNRLIEEQTELINGTLAPFELAYRLVQDAYPPEARASFDRFLGQALPPPDFKVLGLGRMFPKCAEDLKLAKSASGI